MAVRLGMARVDEVPPDDAWLDDAERAVLATLRLGPRRESWRLGRWAAKATLAPLLRTAPAELSVRAAPDGAPVVWRGGAPAGVSLSLSHRAGVALVAVAPAGTALGCDVELVEPRSDAFLAEWLTPAERWVVRAVPDAARALLANLAWSAKESALKALRCGLRADPRGVEVALRSRAPYAAGRWHPLSVCVAASRCEFAGWWRVDDGLVRTLVAAPAPARPD